MPTCWSRNFRNANGTDGKGLNIPLWEKEYTPPYLTAVLLCLPGKLTETLSQQLINDVQEYVMVCNWRKWVRGRGNGDVKKVVFPAQSAYPPLPAHTQTGLELEWGPVRIEATDGKGRERETD